jgi:hypothetical protein
MFFRKGLFTTFTLRPSDIKQWTMRSEMGFDLVIIDLVSGQQIEWFDRYNDSISALRSLAGNKEIIEGKHSH